MTGSPVQGPDNLTIGDARALIRQEREYLACFHEPDRDLSCMRKDLRRLFAISLKMELVYLGRDDRQEL